MVEEQLQRDPTNEQVSDILSESQGKLEEVFQASVEHNSHLLADKWFKYGETCSKTFFDFHRIKKKKTLLKELKVDGWTISDQKDLLITSQDFMPTSSNQRHMPHAPLRHKRDVGERPHSGHRSHERQHDQILIPSRNHGSHHLAPQWQGPKARWNPNRILSRICE